MPLAELPQQPGVCNSIPAFVTRHLRVLRTSEATSQQNCPDYCDLSIISDIRKAIFLITGRISLRILRVCYLGYSVKIFYTSNPNDSSLSQKLQTFMWTLSCFTLSPCLPPPPSVHARLRRGSKDARQRTTSRNWFSLFTVWALGSHLGPQAWQELCPLSHLPDLS